MHGKTDEEVALAVQNGDIESFGFLMQRYEKKLARYGHKFLTDNDNIGDLVQDVFVKAYKNIKSFDTSRQFSSWIYRIAHNEYVNAVKKKWRDNIIPFDFDLVLPHIAAKETADEDSHRQETKLMLDACLEKISSKYREVLVLYYFEELDYKEISEILQIPTSTIGVRLRRGKAILKELVSKSI